MNTTENNQIIADFLHGKNAVHPNQYHENWNELMAVVKMIENKKYYKKDVQFSITKYSVKIQTLTSEDGVVISPCIFSSWGTYGGTKKIQAIYNACLEFIKWYNLQKS